MRGVGPQPWPQDAASSDGQPRQGRALLFAEPIKHQNHIYNTFYQQPTHLWAWASKHYTMELGSYPRQHTNRTSRSRFGALRCPAALHGGNGWTRLSTETNTDATASSPVSRLQPTPRQNYAIQSNHTPTYGSLLAGIHHGQGCSRHTGHHCQTSQCSTRQ